MVSAMERETAAPLPPRCYALVPCAGAGSRAGGAQPKQYIRIAGRAVVAHTLDALGRVNRLAATLVVLAPGDEHFEPELPGWGDDAQRQWTARCGGPTRAASVANGLAELQDRGARDHDWVLVHDAARCLLEPVDVERLIAACEAPRRGDAVGGLLALPLADTLKRQADAPPPAGSAAMECRVSATVDRRGLWQAQTPQMFRIGRLREALVAAGDQVTDEASAIEALGDAPLLVAGSLENFKLTWPADFALAERLLRTRT